MSTEKLWWRRAAAVAMVVLVWTIDYSKPIASFNGWEALRFLYVVAYAHFFITKAMKIDEL